MDNHLLSIVIKVTKLDLFVLLLLKELSMYAIMIQYQNIKKIIILLMSNSVVFVEKIAISRKDKTGMKI